MAFPKKILSLNHLKSSSDHSFIEKLQLADILEFRLDDFKENDLKLFHEYSTSSSWILKSLSDRTILKFMEFKPDFLDLDVFSQSHLIEALKDHVKIILSAHIEAGLEKTQEVYRDLKSYDVKFIKLVVTPPSMIECLKIASFFRNLNDNTCVRFCMGEDYTFTRFFSLIDDHPLIYLGLKNALTAKGQIDIEDLSFYRKSYDQTTLLALIGDPITKSISDFVYNSYFASQDIDALYLKIKIQESELFEAIPLLKRLNLQGLSVTTPLKSSLAKAIGRQDENPYNTLVFAEEIQLYNTDNLALLKLLTSCGELKNLDVLILGCGSLARGFAQTLDQHQVKVYVKNRTREKVETLQKEIPVKHPVIDQNFYDVIIQATSSDLPKQSTLGKVMIECLVDPLWTNFLKSANNQNKTLFFGFEFFLIQGQFQIEQFFPQLNFDQFLNISHVPSIKRLLKKC